jgi:dolichyl-diphosphooligosaccharide---protein glycosyltransferase
MENRVNLVVCLYFQAGKIKRPKHDSAHSAHDQNNGIGSNLKSVIIVAILMLLMMFAVHCTWVTSNAYSSPSIVLAFYNSGDQ